MISKRQLYTSLTIFALVYTILLLPGSGANRIYCRAICHIGNMLFEEFSRGGYVKFTPQEDQNKNDISLFISRSDWKRDGKLTGASAPKASDRIGYLITAFFAALMLATPIPWKRKLIVLTVGLLLITAFVLLKLRIIILHAYTQVPIFGLYQEDAAIQSIGWWYQHLAANTTLGYSVVVIVWVGLGLTTLVTKPSVHKKK